MGGGSSELVSHRTPPTVTGSKVTDDGRCSTPQLTYADTQKYWTSRAAHSGFAAMQPDVREVGPLSVCQNEPLLQQMRLNY